MPDALSSRLHSAAAATQNSSVQQLKLQLKAFLSVDVYVYVF